MYRCYVTTFTIRDCGDHSVRQCWSVRIILHVLSIMPQTREVMRQCTWQLLVNEERLMFQF